MTPDEQAWREYAERRNIDHDDAPDGVSDAFYSGYTAGREAAAKGLVYAHECDGWICEKHPWLHWEHGACPGPGMPCPGFGLEAVE